MDIERYSRQLLLPSWSLAAQDALRRHELLLESRFTAAIAYALAAGVGTVSLCCSEDGERQSWLSAVNPEVRVQVVDGDCLFAQRNCVAILSRAAATAYAVAGERYEISAEALFLHLPQQSAPQRIVDVEDSPQRPDSERWRQFAASVAVAHYLNRFARLQLQVT